MLTNRLYSRTVSTRGGFTLVELLVVIGIIAILAGVALGPITNGIKKAKQSAGLQQAHSIGLAMYSYANDNNQLYPDGSGVDAGKIAGMLMAGGYVSDPTIFGLSGDSNGSYVKVSQSTNTATTITKAQVSWDFMGNSGKGVSSTAYPFIPVMWSTLNGGTQFVVQNSPNVAMTGVPISTCPFGTDGVATFYINNSAAFLTSTVGGGGLIVNMVTAAQNLGGAPAAYIPIPGT